MTGDSMKILSTIAFHYNAGHLEYLRKVISGQNTLSDNIDIFVLTNTSDENEILSIRRLSEKNLNIVTFINLQNPWLLTWAHKQIFRNNINDYTHFIYTEDDIELLPHNIEYWLRWRSPLKKYGLYPSFIRVEFSHLLQKWVMTDQQKQLSISSSPKLSLEEDSYHFINLPNPYQGMLFYDRELMLEHLASPTSDIQQYSGFRENLPPHGGGVAERANFALTFENIPNRFTSRNVAGFYKKYNVFDPASFIHHLPNNYAANPDTSHGKIAVDSFLID